MNSASLSSERRQFGRRWSHVHGWIAVEGRPRLACCVHNFSEGGAFLVLEQAQTLPYTFLLAIEAIGLTIGCEVRHHHHSRVGVRFISPDLVSESGPIWTIDELMARAARIPDRLAE